MRARPSSAILARLIEHHIPRSTDSINDSKVSKQYARLILETYKDPENYFSLVTAQELETLNRIRRAAQELSRAIGALQQPSLDRLNSVTWHPESKFPVALESRNQADLLREGVIKLEEERQKLPEASRNRDWVIAAIAGRCREIWAEEEWRTNPNRYGRLPITNSLCETYYSPENLEHIERYRKHIEVFAPTSDKLNAPGPFGRFLEHILQGVFANPKNENGVSAQSALRSWNNARKQFSSNSH